MPSCTIDTLLNQAKIIGDKNSISAEELLDCVNKLSAYFNTDLKEFSLKLNPRGTEFQKKVWTQLLNIPFGKPYSYIELSKQIGVPKAIYAVANTNGKNLHWIIVPCHRMIGRDSSLKGYAGDLPRKHWLLNHESINKQQSLF